MKNVQFETDVEKATFLAIRKAESHTWLQALSSRPIDICSSHAQIDRKGHHDIKCRKCAVRNVRHAEINGIIERALVFADIPAALSLLVWPEMMTGE